MMLFMLFKDWLINSKSDFFFYTCCLLELPGNINFFSGNSDLEVGVESRSKISKFPSAVSDEKLVERNFYTSIVPTSC